ncbi:MAG: peptide deformylase [Ignavibacteriales bacterium]|nr:peptide deformylase [Ignavibacteriales bacterium]
MAILPINVYGDKILRKKATQVDEKEIEKIIPFIKSMWETMRGAANGVGLAANQVGLNKSIFIVDVSQVEGYEKTKPVVMINPKILLFSEDKIIMEEGCLSLPNLRAEVIRPNSVKILYHDTDLNEKIIEANDFFARVIQHEYDHLHGTFFTDRLVDGLKKQVKEELIKIKNREVKIDYLITQKV